MTVLTDAPFYLPLYGSLVPQNGVGLPTFVRATTKRSFDRDGKLVRLPLNAVSMPGFRCSTNILLQNNSPVISSENFSGGYANQCSLTYDGSTKIVTATVTNVSQSYFRLYTISGSINWTNISIGDSLYIAVQARGVSGSIGKKIYAMSETIGDTNTPISPLTLSSEWQTLKFVRYAKINTTAEFSYIALSIDGASNATVLNGQSVEFKELIVSTFECGYVSAGVLSNPWHGAGTDGVKYFDTDIAGASIPNNELFGAQLNSSSRINNLLWCRDLTNSSWVKNNITPTKNQTGIDGLTNSCTLLTATAIDATVLQTITAAATAACSSFYVKRSVGTGSIYFTRDGGTSWTDITSLINLSTFTRVKIENTSVTNPQVGFKIATSGDAIIADYGQNEAGTEVSMPILTTSASVTRNADVLTYQTAGNFSDTAGTILVTIKRDNWDNNNGSVVGSATRGLYTSASNSGAQALDGTNTVNGPIGTPAGQNKQACKWQSSALTAYANGYPGTPGSYDGAFNLSTIAIMPGTNGYVRDVAIWQSALSDAEILSFSVIGLTDHVAHLVAATSPCLCLGISLYNAKEVAQYIQIHDATSLPIDGSVPKITVLVQAQSNMELSYAEKGRKFDHGVVICNSSTQETLTIGSEDLFINEPLLAAYVN